MKGFDDTITEGVETSIEVINEEKNKFEHTKEKIGKKLVRFIDAKKGKEIMKNKKSTKIIHDRCYFSTQGDIRLREEAEREIRKLGYTDIINFVDHHTAHAYSAYYCSPFDDSFVFTLDGRGDGRCMTLNIATRDEGIKNIDWLTEFDGLGHYYGLITLYLGFRPNRHEGKVLGLAAYGNPETCLPIMKKMVGLEHGRIKAYLGEFYLPHKAFLPNKLKDSLRKLTQIQDSLP